MEEESSRTSHLAVIIQGEALRKNREGRIIEKEASRRID